MSISGTDKCSRRKRSGGNMVLVYLGIAVFCIVTDSVYALFGHGVRSASMSFMFLYPLAAALYYAAISTRLPEVSAGSWGRVGVNAVASGVAALTAGAFLTGILEIAGSSSVYPSAFYILGGLFTGLGVVCTAAAARRNLQPAK